MLFFSTFFLGNVEAASSDLNNISKLRVKVSRLLRGGPFLDAKGGTPLLDEHPTAIIKYFGPYISTTTTSSHRTTFRDANLTRDSQDVMGLLGSPHNLNNLGLGSGNSDLAVVGPHIISSAVNGDMMAASAWDNNSSMRSAGPADWSMEPSVICVNWQRPHHLYFQLGNAFFLLAFLAPHCPFGMLWLRALIVIGCVLMGLYGYMIECQQDIVLWSGLSLIVNIIYLVVVLCRLRPVRFENEIEAVYGSVFKPLRVSRAHFKKILSCMRVIRSLKYQEVYAQEKVTKVDSLSLVLSGKLVVSQNQRALHIVFAHQFLDSPEWFGVSTDDYFQVSIMAMEESRVLIWHRDKLKLSIMAEPFLQTVFDHILGRDVVKKLMQVTQVSESIASNGFLPSGGNEDGEDKPMLIMRKSVEPSNFGLTALINRQLQEEQVPLLCRPTKPALANTTAAATTQQLAGNDAAGRAVISADTGDPNSWRLGRIDETDHETAV